MIGKLAKEPLEVTAYFRITGLIKLIFGAKWDDLFLLVYNWKVHSTYLRPAWIVVYCHLEWPEHRPSDFVNVVFFTILNSFHNISAFFTMSHCKKLQNIAKKWATLWKIQHWQNQKDGAQVFLCDLTKIRFGRESKNSISQS